MKAEPARRLLAFAKHCVEGARAITTRTHDSEPRLLFREECARASIDAAIRNLESALADLEEAMKIGEWYFPYDGQSFVRRDGYTGVEMDVDRGAFEVTIEIGHGYDYSRNSAFVPIEGVVELLCRAGYSVTKEER